MDAHSPFPEVIQRCPMDKYYRKLFEALAGGTLKKSDRAALLYYLKHRTSGRLAALNAVPALRSQHLDSLIEFKRK